MTNTINHWRWGLAEPEKAGRNKQLHVLLKDQSTMQSNIASELRIVLRNMVEQDKLERVIQRVAVLENQVVCISDDTTAKTAFANAVAVK